MKTILSLLALFAMLLGRLNAEDRLIDRAGTYSDETMAVSLVIEDAGPNQIRFTLSYRPTSQTDRVSHAISTQETHGVVQPIAVKSGRWAFCMEKPNMVWFYDGMQRLTLWTINRERGLSRIDTTVDKSSSGPSVLRTRIRQ